MADELLPRSAPSADVAPEDVTDRTELAAALTQFREAAGLSVRELARRIDTPPGTVGGYLSGRHLPGPAQRATFLAMLDACGIDDESRQLAWLDAVKRIRQAPGRRAADALSPYPGLSSFQPEDAAFFFGRSDLTVTVLDLIENGWSGSDDRGLIALVGPSGCGKSSILRAGVIPAVQEGADTALLLAPGEQPSHALASALGEHLGLAASSVLQALSGDADAILPCLHEAGRLLLVLDQAEELFTVCTDVAERRRFLKTLNRLVSVADASGQRHVVCVLALRGDFYAAAASEPCLLPALRSSQVLVGPMTDDEVTQAITGPAAAVGIHVDDGLVRMLLDDLSPHDAPGLAHDGGSLPLLAHALRQTWQVARRGRMTVADYLATGGIAGAVERTAESVWSDLDVSDRDLAKRILLRLVFVDGDAAVTRRRVRLSELVGLRRTDAADTSTDGSDPSAENGPAPADPVAGIVDRFVRARLLTVHRDVVEISHEALLVAWSRLRGWVDADRGGLRVHRQLAEATHAWQDGSRDPSYLLRGGRLAAVAEWVDEHPSLLNQHERAFVDASLRERDRRVAADRRHRRRLRQALAAVAILAVVASGFAVFGFRASAVANERAAEAVTARDQAQSRELAIAADRLRVTDPALSAQLSLIADRTFATVDARSALLDSTASPLPSRIPAQSGPTSVAVDPSRSLLAVTGAEDGSVALWSMADPHAPSLLATIPSASPGRQQFSIAISPDGRRVAVGNQDGLIQRWSIADPRHPVTLPGPGKAFPTGVLSLAYAPDGQTLVAGGAGGAVQRWNVSHPRSLVALGSLPASDVTGAVAFSPDGSLLWAGGDDGVLRAWQRQEGAARPIDRGTDPIVLHAGTSQINAIALSPDGTLVATGDKAGKVVLWRRGSGGTWHRQDQQFPGLTGWVSTLDFSPDGRSLAIGTTGNQVRVVSTTGWSTVMSQQHPGPVTSLAFDGSSSLVAAATDGYVRVWPVPGPVVGPVGAPVFGLALLQGHRLLASPGAAVNKLLSFDVSDAQHPASQPSAAPGSDSVALDGALGVSPDGRLAAVGTGDGRVVLWDVSDPQHPVVQGTPLSGSQGVVEAVGFSADGRMMAVGADDERMVLWDVSDPRSPRKLASTGKTGGLVYSVDFQPGGTLVAGATTAGTVVLWNVSHPRKPRQVAVLGDMDGYALTTAFSPDGSVLAAAGAGRAVHLWDVTDPSHPRALGKPLTGPTNRINMIAFSPDGSRLAAATSDGVVWIWDVHDPAAPTLWAHLHAGGGVLYSLAYSPTGDRLAASGSEQQVWLWTTDPHAAAQHVCRAQGTGITRAEWTLYVKDRGYQPPCG